MEATKNYLLNNASVESEILLALEKRLIELSHVINSSSAGSRPNAALYFMKMYSESLTAYNTIIGTDTGLFDGRISGERRR